MPAGEHSRTEIVMSRMSYHTTRLDDRFGFIFIIRLDKTAYRE